MEFKELAKNRYSCRKISPRPVDPALIEQILETAIAAPTAVNHQPFRIFWMRSPEAREKIRQVTDYTFGADTFLVLGCREEEAWVRPADQRNFGPVDAAIVGTHMMLQIHDLGLVSTWVGFFDAPRLKTLCPQMADCELLAIFPIGYPEETAHPSRLHSQRRPREDLVSEL